MQPLDKFWDAPGLRQEARGWVDRCHKALEAKGGPPPDLDNQAGSLWPFVVWSEANRELRAGNLDTAYMVYDTIRQQREASSSASRESRLPVVYNQLGRVAQKRGDLDVAEEWYRKSIEISEALNRRPDMAMTYHNLGTVAQDRGYLDAARRMVSQGPRDQRGAR